MILQKLVLSFLFLGYFAVPANAQERSRIELLGANQLKFDKSLGIDAQRLIGNVRFKHQGAVMYCDSAYLYNADNSLDAYGKVRVVQGDTLTMRSETLYYNGNTQLIKVRKNVELKDRDMTLVTDVLDFDRITGLGSFYEGGIITSSANRNKLKSEEGIYDSGRRFFYFRDSVLLTNPNYRVETDTLNYDNQRAIAYFEGPTFIYSEANIIYCENGWYDTKLDISQFNENAYLENGSQILRGDSIWYSRKIGIGRAFQNVSITDTTNRTIINGEYGEHNEIIGRSLVTDRATFIQYDEVDSLYLHGDTLLSIQDTVAGNRILAFHHVKFFRKDMQGAADSLSYLPADSMLTLYQNPVLWADELQITGDTVQILTSSGGVSRLYVFDHAFMANKVDSIKYHQIKGRFLTGYFSDNNLYKVRVEGNGESLYYAAESEKPGADSTESAAPPALNYIGVNKAICSNINIHLDDNQVKRIVFLTKPNGVFYPLELFAEDLWYFDGFEWRAGQRPKSREDIYTW